MTLRLVSQMEPIPGYRLVEPLGSGGFGIVWKVQAPGDIPKAMKFVHGNLNSVDGRVPAAQELRSLQRVKNIHHPFLLGLERFDIIDGQLVIVMELADRNLWERYLECQAQGLPGIPRAELLGYLREAAEVLDLMNVEYQLQHLDIKPQNLFLVHNHVKLADFGLVKDLEGVSAPMTSGVTPLYAAPETFEGKLTCHSDQYSLAIVYQELLTGVRPFDGKTPCALLWQHLQAPPNLEPLPAADRPIVAQALAKQPSERFPTRSAFVTALLQAMPDAVPRSTTTLAVRPTPPARQTVASPPVPARQRVAPALPPTCSAAATAEVSQASVSSKQSDSERAAVIVSRPPTPPRDVPPPPAAAIEPSVAVPLPSQSQPRSASAGDTVEIVASRDEPTVHIDKKPLFPQTEATSCPRCGQLLQGSGLRIWCDDCGYPRPELPRQPGDSQPSTTRLLRSWVWVVPGGVGVASVLIALEQLVRTGWPPHPDSILLLLTGTVAALLAVGGLARTRLRIRRRRRRPGCSRKGARLTAQVTATRRRTGPP